MLYLAPEVEARLETAAPSSGLRVVSGATPPRLRYYSRANYEKIPQIQALPPEDRHAIRVVSSVLPFKVNQYVIEQLIDWNRAPDDPLFRLTFPHRDMLPPEDFADLSRLLASGQRDALQEKVRELRLRMNPHPAGQATHNVPQLDGRPLTGMQHKYPETVLFFPAEGQTCHSYCTFCFRWPQFVGMPGLKFEARGVDDLVGYLRVHPEVTDVLFTGGDPMTMPTRVLRSYLEPLLEPELEHVQDLRIGTKSLTYWPHRYLSDPDSDDLLRLFEKLARHRHVALMAHFNHPREMETAACQKAIRRLRDAGVEIRCQSPLLRHINANPETWARMWKLQVRLGCIPYYMFVERDTGPRGYFEVPLARAWDVFRFAYRKVPGLARTVRGPSMSAGPGKVCVDGVAQAGSETVFVLRFLQARNPGWVGIPFFARFDPEARWLDDLRPALGEDRFFFER